MKKTPVVRHGTASTVLSVLYCTVFGVDPLGECLWWSPTPTPRPALSALLGGGQRQLLNFPSSKPLMITDNA